MSILRHAPFHHACAKLGASLAVIAGIVVGLDSTAMAQDRLPWLKEPPAPAIEPYRPDAREVDRTPLPPSYGNSAPPVGQIYQGDSAAQSGSGYDRSGDVYRPSASSGRFATPGLPSDDRPDYRVTDQPRRWDSDRRYDEPRDDVTREESWRDDAPSRHASSSPPPYRDIDRDRYDDRHPSDGTFSMREIVDAGHGFFGSISQGLASVIEYAFKRQGRPNGYILGEDVGGAFVAGLRYGEGRLFTRDAGTHKVYWQGPSIGYDAGAEGSKVMVLVYRLRDPRDVYQRFGGVAGSAYVIGGVGLTFQQRDNIVLAPIRAGLGLRLGANVGYLKYTRRPTWNPF